MEVSYDENDKRIIIGLAMRIAKLDDAHIAAMGNPDANRQSIITARDSTVDALVNYIVSNCVEDGADEQPQED